ncbi:MAG: C-GCAxxG-C-C family protein [Clostridia bacterium]|nr:C-GCAxxG-C-C family protein [Clostridia bacterium]
MTKEEFKTTAVERAKENYKSGMNCCESTFKAMLDTLSDEKMTVFPRELVTIASGMGGGVGGTGNTCGALLGAVMGAGIIHGRYPAETQTLEERSKQMFGPEGKMRLFNNLVNEFAERNGSVVCLELIKAYDYSSVDRRRHCKNLVACATESAVDWLYAGIEDGYAIPYGENIMGAK